MFTARTDGQALPPPHSSQAVPGPSPTVGQSPGQRAPSLPPCGGLHSAALRCCKPRQRVCPPWR